MTSTTTLVDDLKADIDDVLAVRQEIGALKDRVFVVTRTWTGIEVGDGEMTETIQEVDPQPGLLVYGHDLRVKEGGVALEGDVLLHSLSKHSITSREEARLRSTDSLVKKFYMIGKDLYQVIDVIDRYVTWDVHVRRLTDQRRP